jgi:hypothetical protein
MAAFPPPPDTSCEHELPRLYTGPYCVSVTDRDCCIYSLISCLVERKGGKRFPKVTDEWKAFAENLLTFYGVPFWMKELEPYLNPAKRAKAARATVEHPPTAPSSIERNLPAPKPSPFLPKAPEA